MKVEYYDSYSFKFRELFCTSNLLINNGKTLEEFYGDLIKLSIPNTKGAEGKDQGRWNRDKKTTEEIREQLREKWVIKQMDLDFLLDWVRRADYPVSEAAKSQEIIPTFNKIIIGFPENEREYFSQQRKLKI